MADDTFALACVTLCTKLYGKVIRQTTMDSQMKRFPVTETSRGPFLADMAGGKGEIIPVW